MKTLSKIQSIRRGFILSLLAGLFCCSAHATLYTENFSDSGTVPQGGTVVFSAEGTVSDITLPSPYITSIELILTFNDNSSLTGSSSGIQGSLNLGNGTSSPFVSFYPTAATPAGPSYVYDVTFSDFNGLNPNDTWGLVLWDNSNSGIENYLVGWSLDITAVPEPVNVALGIFGVALLGTGVARWRSSSTPAASRTRTTDISIHG
jgi:hypothetical protein